MTPSDAQRQQRLQQAGLAPRCISLEMAAAYVGMSPRSFLRQVAAGLMPAALPFDSSRKIWSVPALDAALAKLAGLDQAGAPVDPSRADVHEEMMAEIEKRL